MLNYERGETTEPLEDTEAKDQLEFELLEGLQDTLPPWLDSTIPESEPAPAAREQQEIPWRSTAVAVLAQIPITLEAAFLDVPLLWLTMQIVIVAVFGLCLVLAEWMSINRVGLADEQPQPNLERPHPHRRPHR